MRNLEAIESDLAAAREALSSVEGTPAEVYSRIVGYYRSVRNWNRGKREEYGERRLFRVNDDALHGAAPSPSLIPEETRFSGRSVNFPRGDLQLLLFVRSSCPQCPAAKAAAGKLGVPVNLVNADTPEGITEAVRRNVLSTPTAILLSGTGEELRRAGNAETISRILDTFAEPAARAVPEREHAEPIAV
jgi:ribonucleoside-triphosphate reductase